MKMAGKKKITVCIALLLVLIAGIWLGFLELKKAGSYKKAWQLMETGSLDKAYKCFKELKGYRDSEEKMAEMVRTDPALPYRTSNRGDTVFFGVYEQNNNASDGAEPVEWLVLDRIDDEVLLLSLFCLDYRMYNDVSFEPVTWETSVMRKWLNEDFYDLAFTDEEKHLVMVMENQNPDHPVVGTEGGKATKDRVYLLNETEIGIYMSDEMEQASLGKASATDYAAAMGAMTNEEGMTEWWVRSPGAYEYTAQFVDTAGVLYTAGAYVELSYGVRPALWLKVGPEDKE